MTGVSGLGLEVQGLGLGFWGSGLRGSGVQGFGFRTYSGLPGPRHTSFCRFFET